MKKSDQWSAVFLFALAVFMCWGALRLPYGNVHNPGPGFFPLWLGMILVAMSIGLFVTTTVDRETVKLVRDVLGKDIRVGKVLVVIVSLILYGGLLDLLGFLLVTFLLMVVLLRCIEPQPWKTVLAWAVSGSLGCYLIFEVWMKLRLPRGILGI